MIGGVHRVAGRLRLSASKLALICLTVVLTGCWADGGVYQVRFDNHSSDDVIIAFDGLELGWEDGSVGDPSSTFILAEAGRTGSVGPVVNLDWSSSTNDWESGTIMLLNANCELIRTFEVRPDNYVLSINEQGATSLQPYRDRANFLSGTPELPRAAGSCR